MEKVAPNSKFDGNSTEIIEQRKIKGPLREKNHEDSINKRKKLFAFLSCLNRDSVKGVQGVQLHPSISEVDLICTHQYFEILIDF